MAEMDAAAKDGKTAIKNWAFWAGPVVALGLGLILRARGLNGAACWTAVVTTWCAVWWIFEVLPLEATSILPFAIFPLTGVMNARQAAAGYGHEMVMLFIGGFMIAQALEKSGVHKRLAMGMVQLVGGRGGKRLVLGFMLASTLLSMWVSNTAVMLMFLPIIMAALQEVDENERKELTVPLMLSILFGVNIGGIGTPVGTPPNIIFMGAYATVAEKGMSFAGWMKVAVPILVIVTPLSWLWLTRNMGRSKKIVLLSLGAWRPEEKRILIVFLLTACGWIFREAPFGGWSALFGVKGAGDSTVALTAVFAMFLWPSGHGGHKLLDWKTASNIPWGILLLVGGGITIGTAFESSGLSKIIGDAIAGGRGAERSIFAMVMLVSIGAGFVTNMMNHTAMATLLMPLLAATAKSAGIDPILLMMPAAISISMAFMMPVSTISNAIIYGTGKVPIQTMIKEGFVPNLIGTLVTGAVCYLLLPH